MIVVGPLSRHHEFVDDCVLYRGLICCELLAVVADVLPLLQRVASLDYSFLEDLVAVLKFSQLLLLLSLVHQGVVGFMLALLVVDCLEVAILSISLLHVELFLEIEVHDARVHLDHIVPKLLLLTVGLLDLSYGHVRRTQDP